MRFWRAWDELVTGKTAQRLLKLLGMLLAMIRRGLGLGSINCAFSVSIAQEITASGWTPKEDELRRWGISQERFQEAHREFIRAELAKVPVTDSEIVHAETG